LPRIRSGKVSAEVLLDLSGLDAQLRYIKEENGTIRIGALATVADIYESNILEGPLEVFKHIARKFGGPQIRNMATIGGNVGAASSSEDFIPVFLALGAKVKLTSINGDRIVPIERFITGKRQTLRRNNEIITEVFFQKPPERTWLAFDKIGRRSIMFIALVSMATYLRLKDDMVEEVRIALNRVRDKIPRRAYETEKFLRGRMLDEETLLRAQEVLHQELSLTSDFRASADYRREVQKVLLKRLLNYCKRRIMEVWP
jgi:carbon-monoxide dehydrogenase medium subunit